jgi:hypothetical protein
MPITKLQTLVLVIVAGLFVVRELALMHAIGQSHALARMALTMCSRGGR